MCPKSLPVAVSSAFIQMVFARIAAHKSCVRILWRLRSAICYHAMSWRDFHLLTRTKKNRLPRHLFINLKSGVKTMQSTKWLAVYFSYSRFQTLCARKTGKLLFSCDSPRFRPVFPGLELNWANKRDRFRN